MTILQRIINDFVLVEGGAFIIGNPLSENDLLRLRVKHQEAFTSLLSMRAGAMEYNIPSPLPTVHVDSFWMSKYPVMQQEWVAVMAHNPAHFSDPVRPVECITWQDAVVYCNERSYQKNLTPCYRIKQNRTICDFQANGYRLPTEAEWEYAARGGQAAGHFIFPGSNDIDAVAWHRLNAGLETHQVGQKQPNELGLYDLAGNVYELCWDWHHSRHKPQMNAVNPTGPTKPPRTQKRVVRGGCYRNSPHLLYTGRRLGRTMSEANDHLGFRVVRSIES